MSLKESIDSGAQLDRDQQEAVRRLHEVTIQLDLVRELQKQFAAFSTEVRGGGGGEGKEEGGGEGRGEGQGGGKKEEGLAGPGQRPVHCLLN